MGMSLVQFFLNKGQQEQVEFMMEKYVDVHVQNITFKQYIAT